MHALIIDDSRAMRSILRRIVTDLGFETSRGRQRPGGARPPRRPASVPGPVPDRLEHAGDGRLHLRHQGPGEPRVARHHADDGHHRERARPDRARPRRRRPRVRHQAVHARRHRRQARDARAWSRDGGARHERVIAEPEPSLPTSRCWSRRSGRSFLGAEEPLLSSGARGVRPSAGRPSVTVSGAWEGIDQRRAARRRGRGGHPPDARLRGRGGHRRGRGRRRRRAGQHDRRQREEPDARPERAVAARWSRPAGSPAPPTRSRCAASTPPGPGAPLRASPSTSSAAVHGS